MLLHLQIDPRSGLPVYRQMMDQIKYYIASGTLTTGDQLPSVRELAQALSVNPTTVVKAYTELEHEQVIELRHGKGAFVTAHPGRFSAREKEKVLRRMARQLAVEAGQMGAGLEWVQALVGQEWGELYGGGSGEAERGGRGG
jgi:GntR family transcriptional regulator